MGVIKSVKSGLSKVKSTLAKIGPAIQGDNYGTGTIVGGVKYVQTGEGVITTGKTSTPTTSPEKKPTVITATKRSFGGSSSPISSLQDNLQSKATVLGGEDIKIYSNKKLSTQLELQKKLLKISGVKNNKDILDKIVERNRVIRESQRKQSYSEQELKRRLLNTNGKSGYDILTEKLLSNPEYLKRTTETLSRNVSKDLYNGNKFKKAADILTEGKITAKQYSNLQGQINANTEFFNKKYGEKELSEKEYKEAEQVLANINYSQQFLDKQKEKATGELKKTITEISKSKHKVLPLLALGIVSGAVDYGYGIATIPKDIVRILNNPRQLKNLSPRNIYNGFKDNLIEEINYYKLNKTFGIARIVTKAGLMFTTAKINQKGINLLKKINPEYKTKLISSLNKIPKKNVVNVRIDTLVRRVGKNVSIAKIDIDGKGIRGLAAGFVVKVGKNKVYNLATGLISTEGRFLRRTPKPFVTIGKSAQKKVLKTIAEREGLKIGRVYSAVGTKGYSITKIPLRSRNLFEKSMFKREHFIDEFLAKSLYNKLNKNLGYVIGVAQSKSGVGVRFGGYIRDITEDIQKSLRVGTKFITSPKVKIIKEEILNNPNLKISQKQFLIKKIDKAVNHALENSLKESAQITNSVAGIVSKESKRIVSGIKNNAIRKVAVNVLPKVIANVSKTIIKESTKNKSVTKEKSISLIKEKLKSSNLNKYVQSQVISAIEKTVQKPIQKLLISPGRINIVNPIVPRIEPPISIMRTKEINGIPNIIQNKRGHYFGYDVSGISKRARQKLTKYPLSFDKSLSVASYFALNSKKGYSILKHSSRKVSKNTVNRELPKQIPRNYYLKNRSRLKIIKYRGKLIIKRK